MGFELYADLNLFQVKLWLVNAKMDPPTIPDAPNPPRRHTISTVVKHTAQQRKQQQQWQQEVRLQEAAQVATGYSLGGIGREKSRRRAKLV